MKLTPATNVEPGRKYLTLGGVSYDVTDVSQEEQEAAIQEYVEQKKSYNPVEETK